MKKLLPLIEKILLERYKKRLNGKIVSLKETFSNTLLEDVGSSVAKGVISAAARALGKEVVERIVKQIVESMGKEAAEKLGAEGLAQIEQRISLAVEKWQQKGLKGQALSDAVENEMTGSMRIGPRSAEDTALPIPQEPVAPPDYPRIVPDEPDLPEPPAPIPFPKPDTPTPAPEPTPAEPMGPPAPPAPEPTPAPKPKPDAPPAPKPDAPPAPKPDAEGKPEPKPNRRTPKPKGKIPIPFLTFGDGQSVEEVGKAYKIDQNLAWDALGGARLSKFLRQT